MPCDHPACLPDDELLKQCTVTAGRNAGGPGGQNRNKVATFVEITHVGSGLSAHAGERRSQLENKGVALRRLRLALAVNIRSTPAPPPPIRGKTLDDFLQSLDAAIGAAGKPSSSASELWSRRVGSTRYGKSGKIACNPEHPDYPALLAEALDMIAARDWEPKRAAKELGVTPSQLIKLVKDEPPAMAMWNAERAKRGKHELK